MHHPLLSSTGCSAGSARGGSAGAGGSMQAGETGGDGSCCLHSKVRRAVVALLCRGAGPGGVGTGTQGCGLGRGAGRPAAVVSCVEPVTRPVRSRLAGRCPCCAHKLFASPAAVSRRGCSSYGPRETVGSHDSLLLRLQSGLALTEVRRLHAALLVCAYARLRDGGLRHALRLFDGMLTRNSFAWNAVIKGLVDTGRFSEALRWYRDMVCDGSVVDDRFTYPPVLKACAALGEVEQGRKVQENVEADIAQGIANHNVFVQCALVDMFAKNVFESMGVRDLAAWTAMIGGTVHGGDWLEVMTLLKRMKSEGFRPDSMIFATVIPACAKVKELRTGMALRGYAVKCGVGVMIREEWSLHVTEKLCRGLCASEAERSRRASSSCLASLMPLMASRWPPAWCSSRASSAATTASASWFTFTPAPPRCSICTPPIAVPQASPHALLSILPEDRSFQIQKNGKSSCHTLAVVVRTGR